ncbi:hypothetical protein D3C85_907100 [compost metagenome]
MAPSTAADMVPEYSTLTELFKPWFIPDTHKSGFLPLKILFTAILTQSTGVPLHLYISTPS